MALIYKKKAENAEAENIENRVAVQDAPLAAQQQQTEEKIKQVDEDIQKIMDERQKNRDQYLSDQERADRWKK